MSVWAKLGSVGLAREEPGAEPRGAERSGRCECSRSPALPGRRACGAGVSAAGPPSASRACGQAAAVALGTGGTRSRKKHRWKMFYFSSEEGWTLKLVRRWLGEGFNSDIVKL